MDTTRLHKLKEMEAAQPHDPFVKYAIALEYVSGGQWHEAEKYFHTLCSDFPDYLPTYYHFGALAEQTGNPALAKTLYEKGIALAGKQGDAKTERELRQALLNLTA
ncbi:MAG: hypothetical protein NZM35_04745 [Chitinophagales bacterium]|nr:hypothetical protein [Chitinophagales bacterium]MDW8418931.1 hypothetical protein [Chitinophagales bacterium]